jgi:hypothetical protein
MGENIKTDKRKMGFRDMILTEVAEITVQMVCFCLQ